MCFRVFGGVCIGEFDIRALNDCVVHPIVGDVFSVIERPLTQTNYDDSVYGFARRMGLAALDSKSARPDHNIRLFRGVSGGEFGVWSGHTGYINCVTRFKCGAIASGSDDQCVRMWRLGSTHSHRVIETNCGPVTKVQELPNGYIATLHPNLHCCIWDSQGQKVNDVVDNDIMDIIKIDALEGFVCSTSIMQTKHAHVVWTGKRAQGIDWNSNGITLLPSLAFIMGAKIMRHSRHPHRILLLNENGGVAVLDIKNQKAIHVIPRQHQNGVIDIASLDESTVLALMNDMTFVVWDTGGCVHQVYSTFGKRTSGMTSLQDGTVITAYHNTISMWR